MAVEAVVVVVEVAIHHISSSISSSNASASGRCSTGEGKHHGSSWVKWYCGIMTW